MITTKLLTKKKKVGFCLLLFTVYCLLLSVSSYAAVPQTINFQGRLTDNSGNPLGGTVDLTFKIFDAVTGGTEKWTETQNSVSLANGLFNVMLSTIGYSVFDGTDRWIEITVGSDTLSPRQKLGSVAYAYYANLASTATYAVNATSSVYAVSADTFTTNNLAVTNNITIGGLVDGVDISTITFGGSSGWTLSGTTVSLTNSNYYVGIGTTSPAAKLHVAGGIKADTVPFYFAKGTTDITGTATESDMAEMSLSVTTDGSPVRLTFFAGFYSTTAGTRTNFRIYRDATDIRRWRNTLQEASMSEATSCTWVDQPAAGTYTYKVTWETDANTTRCYAATSNLNFRVFTAEVMKR